MALREDFERQGSWLFRWRSYLPLLAAPVFILALRDIKILQRLFDGNISGLWDTLAIIVSFLGLGIRSATAGFVPRGTSGRNTRWQAADVLNTTGMYSIVRNPLYLGNFVIVFGITLFMQVWWFVLTVCVGFWLYYERIIFTEEEFLRKRFADKFLEWAKVTPVIMPRFANWKKPDLDFSFKTVLRREFSTYISIVATFFFLELTAVFLTQKRLFVRSCWLIFFLVSLGFYFTLLFLKKKTRVLDVSGR